MLGYSFLWWCGAIVSVTAAVYAIPKLWRAMLRVFEFVSGLDKFARLLPQFIHMLKQFYPNAGTSLVDRIAKLEEGHTEILALNLSQCDSFALQGKDLSEVKTELKTLGIKLQNKQAAEFQEIREGQARTLEAVESKK